MSTAALSATITRPGAVAVTLRAQAPGLTRRLAIDLGRTSTATCRRGPLGA